ncbi:F-box only protein 34 [Callorhinchus milii]|uniref:F-box protein 34 n=1 Tax=Callorhinchus milii TaxID=7868 RepID=A0A4W3GC06_CALMI|nr:F-box only protein 34 [Callorhinchus milii]XP_007891471.1 F-box only protein 34 [Callorhinchus milii]|eukprot:gi/632951748/ref/XP_007891470.1/ PREDICTED: F-box only protein 34 [Callorhinchus milii]
MHLKPYPKLPKKDVSLEPSQQSFGGLHSSQHATVRVERCQATYTKQSSCESITVNTVASHISLWCPRPFGINSQNKMCNMKNPSDNATFKGRKKRMSKITLPPSIHQEEGEVLLDIWAVIKPGNTKEKIAFFAAQQSNRTGSVKIKGNWDTDVTTAKRRKKSVDLEKIKVQPNRVKENGKEGDRKSPPTTSSSEENASINSDGLCHSSSLSVAEMVALLEQRANALLPDCTKILNSNINMPSIGHSTGTSPSPEAISAAGSDFCFNHKRPTENKTQGECVRVIEVIARLESECLKNQHERNGESLSRNNSFRRGVGRVLLTGPQQSEQKPSSDEVVRTSPEVSRFSNDLVESNERHHSCISMSHTSTACTESCKDIAHALGINLSGAMLDLPNKVTPTCKETKPFRKRTKGVSSNDGMQMEYCSMPSFCWEMDNRFVSNCILPGISVGEYPNDFRVNKELVSSVVDEDVAMRLNEEAEFTSVTGSCPEEISSCEEPPPGELFFTLAQSHVENLDSNEKTTEEIQEVAQDKYDTLPANKRAFEGAGFLEESCPSLYSSVETSSPLFTETFPLRRQVSHEFLEMRFKIQQLLEPRQYMAFLPHHIMVKIFMFLPTRTLAALKCTCHYFKFIIENYGIRATDSLWVRDPRYKDDPCKQCRKHYSKGDVSPCRWHSKPYYKVLPYGRSYWMCCWQAEKDSPGCKIGLHDNNWVQSCNHIQQICEKVKKKNGEGV